MPSCDARGGYAVRYMSVPACIQAARRTDRYGQRRRRRRVCQDPQATAPPARPAPMRTPGATRSASGHKETCLLRGPGCEGEQLHGFVVRGSWHGLVDRDAEAAGTGVKAFVGKGDVADDRVVEGLVVAVAAAHVVAPPKGGEFGAGLGELGHERGQVSVVRVGGHGGAELSDGGCCGLRPVGVEDLW